MEIMNYKMSEDGTIIHVLVGFRLYHGEEQFTGRTYITQEYLDSVRDGLDIHKLSHEHLGVYARRKLKSQLDVVRPEPEESEEGEPEE